MIEEIRDACSQNISHLPSRERSIPSRICKSACRECGDLSRKVRRHVVATSRNAIRAIAVPPIQSIISDVCPRGLKAKKSPVRNDERSTSRTKVQIDPVDINN